MVLPLGRGVAMVSKQILCPIGDMYSHDGDADEPEWVKTEREQFVEFRDKNRDGKMDKEETKDWILPSDYDHAEAEARHLVYESDQNKVGMALWCEEDTGVSHQGCAQHPRRG